MSSNKYCAVVKLDVKNACWKRIKTLLVKTSVGSYLTKLLESRGVLVLPVPQEAAIIGFTWSSRSNLKMLKCTLTKTWPEMVQLDLAERKMEAILIINRRKRNTVNFRVGGHIITSKWVIKYLGLMIDFQINFKDHLDYACEKGAKTNVSLVRMMPNIGGSRYSRRLLVAGVVRSTVLYAAPVWEEALACESNRRRINMTSRLAVVRVCSAFRTISSDAACVISGMIPMDILASEARYLYEKRRTNLPRKDTEYQKSHWKSGNNGGITRRMVARPTHLLSILRSGS